MAKSEGRQPFICVAVGQTGVGKTFRSVQEINLYAKSNPKTGKKGRKVLIFDVNAEADYKSYPSVDFNVAEPDEHKRAKPIRELKNISVRKIIPFRKNGESFSNKDKQLASLTLLHNFTHGLLVLEDINNYQTNFAAQDFISILVNNRHRNQDILLHIQSLAKIATTLWQNLTIIRLHKQVDSPSRYKDRIPNYELVAIADIIVNNEFKSGNKYFFLYINVRTEKISGATFEQFRDAAKLYCRREASTEIAKMMNDCNELGKRLYSSQEMAVAAWISDRERYLSIGK